MNRMSRQVRVEPQVRELGVVQVLTIVALLTGI